jgi:hypothetical protein
MLSDGVMMGDGVLMGDGALLSDGVLLSDGLLSSVGALLGSIAAQAEAAVVSGDPGPVMGVVIESLPGAPLSLAVSAVSSSQLKLTWKDGSANEDGFQIERCAGLICTNFTQVATVAANTTTYSNTGLVKNTTYSYRLRAYNGAGYSSFTAVVSKATLR